MSLRIPLHLSPEDRSAAAEQKRFDLATRMAELNPSGFRTPGKKPHSTSMVESLAKRCGMTFAAPERSIRSQEKQARRQAHVENVMEQKKRGLR